MNKYTIYTFLIMLFLISGCEKDKNYFQESDNIETSNINDVQQYKFQKEIIVFDESKKNSMFLRISSDDENAIEEYIANHELTLKAEENDFFEVLKNDKRKIDKSKQEQKPPPDLDDIPHIVVEFITENIEDNFKNISLEVKSINNNGKGFLGWILYSASTKTPKI